MLSNFMVQCPIILSPGNHAILADGSSGSDRLAGAEMAVTEHRCLTCGSLILDNTTSTTACVKCARLRTRRLNFASPPHRSHKSSDR